MFQYILKRLLGLLSVLFGITLLVFMFLHRIPGDPAAVLLGERGTPEQMEFLRYLLQKPLKKPVLSASDLPNNGDRSQVKRGKSLQAVRQQLGLQSEVSKEN
ncbi:MAG: hypothetical protein MUE44_01235 [Oscillatoriaceae cyanobacterium Prado104]|jgi:ABC-type dipeptide/oligopeptide/nickel transport system permease component|nr:hypothetical protein [Oscillatoriaceae cyanobacterium Prado104]